MVDGDVAAVGVGPGEGSGGRGGLVAERSTGGEVLGVRVEPGVGVAFEDSDGGGGGCCNIVNIRYTLFDVVFDVDDAGVLVVGVVVVEIPGGVGESWRELPVDGDLNGGDFGEGRIVDDDLVGRRDVLLDEEAVAGSLARWRPTAAEGVERGALLDEGVVFGDHFVGGADVVGREGVRDDGFVRCEEVVFFAVGLVERFGVDTGGGGAFGEVEGRDEGSDIWEGDGGSPEDGSVGGAFGEVRGGLAGGGWDGSRGWEEGLTEAHGATGEAFAQGVHEVARVIAVEVWLGFAFAD